jgi:hypothetical protein
MCLQKVVSGNFFGQKLIFVGIMKINDENSRIRIQDPDPNPDPLVRGMDPTKMSWIRNTKKVVCNDHLMLRMETAEHIKNEGPHRLKEGLKTSSPRFNQSSGSALVRRTENVEGLCKQELIGPERRPKPQ